MRAFYTFILGLVLVFGILGTAYAFWSPPQAKLEDITILSAEGEEFKFQVEIADTPRLMATGLMNRTALAENAGMLFLFGPPAEPRTFWMKNTLIPLDMLFIESDGRINHIHQNARPQDQTRITSGKPAVAVLEINGGQSYKLGIKEGDQVLHPFFRNQFKAQ